MTDGDRVSQSSGLAVQAVITVDTDGAIVFWSRSAESLLGYLASDAIGASLDMVIPKGIEQPIRTDSTGLWPHQR